MPHEERAAALDRLTEALWGAWTKAGAPSYSDFAKRSEELLGSSRRLSSSTTQEILTGHRSGPMKWDWVRRFWAVVRAVAADHDIDPDSLGTLDALKEMHEAACAERRRTRQLAGVASTGANDQRPSVITGYHLEPCTIPGQMPVSASAAAEEFAEIRQKIGVEWWHDYEDVVPDGFGIYLSLEPAAKLIHSYQTTAVPGLLQTAAYAGAVIQQGLDTPSEGHIARLVELRMRRQQILTQPNPPRLWAVFHEAAFLRRLGDTAIMRTQIKHLMEISELPNVTIQMIPSGTRIRAVLGYPITLLRFHVHEITDIIYFEQLTSAFYLHTPEHASRYAQVLTGLSAEALQPARTIDYLGQMLRYT